jgi:hypothetical protein
MSFLDWFKAKPDEASPMSQTPVDGQVEVVVKLSGEPEAIAQQLIAGDLPKTFLDEVDISNQEGQARLLACMMLRRRQASLEKDEIVRFVRRNEAALKRGGLDMLRALCSASGKVEGGKPLGQFFDYFTEQVDHALAGHPEKIDVKSDRLLWLCYALALKVSDGFSHREAVRILSKPEHRARISKLSLAFMLRDWAEAMGTREFPDTEYLMLIAECALLSDNPGALSASYAILTRFSPAGDAAAWSDLMRRAAEELDRRGRLDEEGRQFLRKMDARFRQEIPDDDL